MRNRTLTFILSFSFLIISVLTATGDAAVVYTVKPKDTLWKIAKAHNVPIDAIMKANSELESEKDLKAGMVLMIPDPADDVVPLESDATTTTTRTLIVHGAGPQYQSSTEKNVNIMTVDGRTIRVPTYKPPEKLSNLPSGVSSEYNSYEARKYRSKFLGMSSRGMGHIYSGNSIVKTAFRYIGVPYVFGGSTPSGFDCSGFVQYVFAQNGIKTPRLAHHQFYAGTPIQKSQLQPGDLVFFETYTVGISHVGIYIGNGNFIHASSKGAVRVDSLNEDYYLRRYRGAARY